MTELAEQSSALKDVSVPVEKVSLSKKLNLLAVPLDHSQPEGFPSVREFLSGVFKQSDGVILEYLPDELLHMDKNELVKWTTDYSEIVPFFYHAKELARKHQKDIWLMDPAHNEAFALVRAIQSSAIGGFLTAPVAIETLVKSIKKEKLTRRSFLGRATFALGATLAGASILGDIGTLTLSSGDDVLFERYFRGVVIAKGLEDLGKKVDNDELIGPQNLALVYPPEHWQRIKRLLEDPNLDTQFNFLYRIYSLLGERVIHSLFTTRHYIYDPQNEDFKLQETAIKPN